MTIKTREICLYGLLGALTFALKFVMSPLPNIEPVSILMIVFAIIFGYQAFYPLVTYIFLEILVYGFSFWSIGYFYMWPILVISTLAASKITSKMSRNVMVLFYACISGLFGLCFGALYIPLYLATGGISLAMTWWISGIPYDIIHGVSNFIICLIAFKPLHNTLHKLNNHFNTKGE